MAYPYIPLIRHLHYGLKGKDVTAVQLALRHARYRKENPTGRYGLATKHEVGEFKKHHGIHVEVGYDDKTHKALWPSFGALAHSIYKDAWDRKHTVTVGQKIVNTALYGASQAASIHYSQGAMRMKDFGPPPNVPNYTDCSGFATWCYKCAGAPDPNGFGYNGYGYTGTMLLHGTKVSLSSLQKGDLIFYGSPVSHVTVYVGGGRCVSHGSEIGPILVEALYRGVNQARRYIK
jgi:cell wall-associated NlpC family hydrolase